MIKTVYTGTQKIKVKFVNGMYKKIMPNDLVELSELDFSNLSTTGNFELIKNVEKKVETKKENKKITGGKK